MSFLKKLISRRGEQDVVFDRTMRRGPASYELYTAADAEKAKAFLLSRNVTQGLFYIEVETPLGTWGVDKDGLYLVELLPWQKDLSLAECEGQISRWPSLQAVQVASQGMMDNAVAMIRCGSCGHEWWDGIQLQNATVVRCPECKTHNQIPGGKVKVTHL